MNRETLSTLSETELLQLIRNAGIGILKRGIDHTVLESILLKEVEVLPGQLSPTNFTRDKLQKFITARWAILSNQLPGCDGKCTTYPCSEAQHISCFNPNRELVLAQ